MQKSPLLNQWIYILPELLNFNFLFLSKSFFALHVCVFLALSWELSSIQTGKQKHTALEWESHYPGPENRQKSFMWDYFEMENNGFRGPYDKHFESSLQKEVDWQGAR